MLTSSATATRTLLLALGVMACACNATEEQAVDIPFGDDGVDFARLEHELPLGVTQLEQLTPANMQTLTQEQLDQLYARLRAGPIPTGPFDGTVFSARGTDASRFAEIVGAGIAGGFKGRAADLGVTTLEFLAGAIWRGKTFDPQARLLHNRISDLQSLQPLLDEIPDSDLNRLYDTELGQYLVFPAKLYCGQSLLDGRRESIIIDYAYSDELSGHLEPLDRLVGRDGLRLREELRTIRPGFHLGRVYVDRIFALNLTLVSETSADPSGGRASAEDCWPGEQRPGS